MTRTAWADRNPSQGDVTHPDLRHLFKNAPAGRATGGDSQLPVRYLKSSAPNSLQVEPSPGGVLAGVLVRPADTDSTPSQVIEHEGLNRRDKCHFMAQVTANATGSMYGQMIRESLAKQGRIGIDPRHVEAFMRGEYSTLDHLGGARWTRAVREAAECVEACEPGFAERVAQSYGL